MSLDIHFVGLNSFLVLSSNWRRGESATSHDAEWPNWREDDALASNLACVGPTLGIRAADGGRYDRRRLLRAVRRISE
jgi:hypothetical protein